MCRTRAHNDINYIFYGREFNMVACYQSSHSVALLLGPDAPQTNQN